MKKLLTALIVLTLTVTAAACSNEISIDKDKASALYGTYQIMNTEESDNYWTLYIGDDDGNLQFSIYDSAAGNPGVEGLVTFLDDTTIRVSIDKDLFEKVPSDKWECDGETLEVTYEKTQYGIKLTNNDSAIEFGAEQAIATRLVAEDSNDSRGITSIDYVDGHLVMEGSIYTEEGGWQTGTYKYKLQENLEFADWARGNDNMNVYDFLYFINSAEADGLVIEMNVIGNEIQTGGVSEENVSLLGEF